MGVQEALAPLRERYVELLIAGDAREAQLVVEDALRRSSASAVHRELIADALYEIGDRWERGEVGVGEEHIATGICELALPSIAARLPRLPRRRRTVVVACAPWELHAIGSRIVADVLEAGGWEVLYLGALVPASVLAQVAVARGADVVALSGTTSRSAAELEEAHRRLLRLPRPPLVAVGGQALRRGLDPSRLEGAVAAVTPEELMEQLDQRFPVERPQG